MKEKQITPISQFPTEVLVFYFKKFRKVRHYEYDKEIYGENGEFIDDWGWVVEDKTTVPFEYDDGEDNYFDDGCMYIQFEGMYWRGKRDEFIKELNSRENVNITAKNFKDWKREYKKSLKR